MGVSMTIGGITPSTLQSAAPVSAALLPGLEGPLVQAPDVLVLHGAAERIDTHECVQRGQEAAIRPLFLAAFLSSIVTVVHAQVQ